METIKPIKIGSRISASSKEPLSSAEIGKLWAAYMGNSMGKCVLSYFLKNTEDDDIKHVVQHALNLSEEIVQIVKTIMEHENFPVPAGFTDKDVNLSAPRLFDDEFYLHYLKYAGKAGLSIYGIAIPLMLRPDVRDFFIHIMEATIKMMSKINDVLIAKGKIMKPPAIPIPKSTDFVKKESYLHGFLGNVRPLHALEITHLHSNIENNVTSKALLIGFSQTARNEKVRDYFLKGKELTAKQIEDCSRKLHKEDLPSPTLLDHLVGTSKIAPFSDKLMLFHKIDMFSMKIRSYSDGASVNGRHDIGVMYAQYLMEISFYVNEGAKIMIDHQWMESPPKAANRDELASN